MWPTDKSINISKQFNKKKILLNIKSLCTLVKSFQHDIKRCLQFLTKFTKKKQTFKQKDMQVLIS